MTIGIGSGGGKIHAVTCENNKILLRRIDDAIGGDNASGQLGQGDTIRRGDGLNEMGDDLPTINLGSGRSAALIATGVKHTCALLDDATVKCWGENSAGQLGQGNVENRGDGLNEMGDNLPPVDLGSGRSALAISTGASHTCAVLDNATVKCWGDCYQDSFLIR